MFKFIGNLFSKISLAALIRNISLDIDTVVKKNGHYLRIMVKAFGIVLLDENVKLSSQTVKSIKAKDTLKLDAPIDEFLTNNLKEAGEKAGNRLAVSLNRGKE